MIKKTLHKKLWFIALLFILIIGVAVFHRFSKTSILPDFNKPSEESFQAPGKDWQSPKKVEDYFVERLHMTSEEAKEARSSLKGNDGKIMLRLTHDTKLPALLSNLEHYGLVKDEKALEYALAHTVDTEPGQANPLKIGNNTIDIWAFYRISEDMTAWEIADQLLNHPSYFAYDEYGYMFMP